MGYIIETHKLYYCPTGHYPCHHPCIIGTKSRALYWRSLYCHFHTLLSRNSPVNTLQNLKRYNFYSITFSCFHMEPPTVSYENKPTLTTRILPAPHLFFCLHQALERTCQRWDHSALQWQLRGFSTYNDIWFFYLLKQTVRGYLPFRVALHLGKYGTLKKTSAKAD